MHYGKYMHVTVKLLPSAFVTHKHMIKQTFFRPIISKISSAKKDFEGFQEDTELTQTL